MMTADPGHWALAGGLLVAWLAASVYWLRPTRRAVLAADTTLVLHASQTGQALELAETSLQRLRAGGQTAAMMPLGQVTADELRASARLLVIAATTGFGEAPDDARGFTALMASSPDLSSTSFAVLALGDRRYEDFCAFGRSVDTWMAKCGATPLHDRIDVDDLAPESLKQWHGLLDALGAVQTGEASASPYQPWRIAAREHLNPTDQEDDDTPALWQVILEPRDTALPSWVAGDLFEVETPSGHRRDYSVASLPEEGRVMLLVRAVHEAGEGSSLLTTTTPVGGCIPARLRDHSPFHAPAGTGPVLFIAAGSGLAGIRPHLIECMRSGRAVWLILGERRPDVDARTTAEAQGWQAQGRLTRLDLAYSRGPSGEGRYVQDVIATDAPAARAFLGQQGAVMLCGALAMGKCVEAVLHAALGAEWLTQARAQGRYHADLY